MSFASPLFLWYFLPAVLLAVLMFPRSWRNGIISIGSMIFYATGAGASTLLLLVMMAVNFAVGPQLEPGREPQRSPALRKRLLIGVIVFDVGVLALWKYAGFATETIAGFAQLLGGDFPIVELALPIAISFYTFHHISYAVDTYRGDRRAARSLVDFAVYMTMFPQFIAGPIVRFREIADQLPQQRQHRLDDIAAGFPRFALGLCKKAIVADSLAPLSAACFATPDDEMTFAIAWLGAITFTLQLFFDFSGYSDMAIGMGRMLGFRLPENFARPYASVTVTEFWRRWHMSLSRWFRDYVYIPLGGNRGGTLRTYRNLSIVFLLTGLWHGAAWTFVVWGAFHGVLLIIERAFGLDGAPATPLARAGRRAVTIVLVMFGWVMFNADSMDTALTMMGHMVVPDTQGLSDVVSEALTNQRFVILLAALTILLLPAHPVTGPLLESSRGRIAGSIRVGVMTVGLAYASILLAAGTFSPFLYYQF